MGYANRVLKLDFPELSEDTDTDPIWVTIRNPRLVPPHELTPEQVTPIVDGQPEDQAAANASMHNMVAKLVVGWRAYDATQPIVLDAAGNDTTVPELLPPDFSAVNVAKLPMEIINRIAREMQEASNPR